MHPPPSVIRRPPALAIALSLILHLLVLLIPLKEPTVPTRPARRLQARLAPRTPTPTPTPPVVIKKPVARHPPIKPKQRILAMERPHASVPTFTTPKWTEAEKAEMNEFLAETAREAKAQPTLAQRSLAMARDMGQRLAQEDGEGETLERIPDTPPVDPFSLELYMDALVKKLNRSSAFVQDQRKKQGQRTASVRVRLNPDGTLESLKVLNAADQQDEIEFIKSVVRQATPFSPFPSDLRKSTRSLSMLICIQPPRPGGSVGFSRASGKGC